MTALVVPLACLAGVLGLAVGSFLNVVVYRVPAGESVVSPGSHCPRCDTPIKNRHNVPVVGWLMLRGRCASCSERISVRYPLVEAATGALFVALVLRFQLSPALPAFLYLAAIGLTLALIDADTHRLPDLLVLPSYVVGIALLMPAAAAAGEWDSAIRALAGMAALGAMFAVLSLAGPRGVGHDEPKLAALLGLYLGWLSWACVFFAALGAFVFVGVVALLARLTGAERHRLPIGSCLVAATVTAVFISGPLLQWYGSLLPA